jgi:hypothetical protein
VADRVRDERSLPQHQKHTQKATDSAEHCAADDDPSRVVIQPSDIEQSSCKYRLSMQTVRTVRTEGISQTGNHEEQKRLLVIITKNASFMLN